MQLSSYNDIIDLKYSLSSSMLIVFEINNKNIKLISDLLDRELKNSDKGIEIGSINYIDKSNYYFIRAKALQEEYFIPYVSSDTIIPIKPRAFKNYNLKKGDILISKDSNIGEAVILEKDYDNHTISGALYKLPITKYKYYLFAFLKHEYLKKQLDLLVPKGATIKHAKKIFLDCKIPFPNQENSDEVIVYVEKLVQAILNKEKIIKNKYNKILELIENEINSNQIVNDYETKTLTYNDLIKKLRIDAAYNNDKFKNQYNKLKNYTYGSKTIFELGYKTLRGQNLQVSNIGKSIYSNKYKNGFYTLIRPTNFSEFGTISKFEYFGNKKKLKTINFGDIIFSSEGNIGKAILFVNQKEKCITNIHGTILNADNTNIIKNTFIVCIFFYLRNIGYFSSISVGGQGGSITEKYWKDILIPNFPEQKEREISKLYFNNFEYNLKINSYEDLNIFLETDLSWNNEAGIIDIDNSIKYLKEKLNIILEKIIINEFIDIYSLI